MKEKGGNKHEKNDSVVADHGAVSGSLWQQRSGGSGNPGNGSGTDIASKNNYIHDCESKNIRFVDNYFVNGTYGWRQMNMQDFLETDAQSVMFRNVLATGEVLFENNLFYRGVGALVKYDGEDLQNGAVLPTLRGNTYVQDKGQLLFVKGDEVHGDHPETTVATSDRDQMETCVRVYMGDATGKVVILE